MANKVIILIVVLCCLEPSVLGGNGHRRRDRKPKKDEGDHPGDGMDEEDQGVKADLPDVVEMNIPMRQGRVKLNLQKSQVINASLPVYIGTERYSYTQLDTREREDFVVYQDPDKRASFVMWNNTKRQNGHSRRGLGVRGIFDNAGESFAMEPLAFRESRSVSMDITEGMFTFNESDFVVTQFDRSNLFNPLAEQAINNKSSQMFEDIAEYINKSAELGHQYPRYNYEVELFMVVDFATFEKWLKASSARDYKTREIEAIDDIRFYFAHIINGMAMRYMSVDEADFEIRIIPAGLYIAKTAEASFWTESYPVKEAFHYTEAYKALDLFEEWINDEKSNLPPFDQATLFSSNNLFSGYYNGRRRTINGLASITGICGYYRASINYDQGQYGSIQNAAHELGHNLGSYHDGYNNNCQSRDQYIMATSPGVLTESNFDNVFEFSSCSKRAFWEYLLYLNDRDENCLLERTNTDTYWNYENYLQRYPGQRYTANEQCKLIYGPQSSYCGGGNLDEAICSVMYCWRPQEGDCTAHVEQRAADATPCSDRKWCMEGRCVFDSRAPAIPNPTCIYGDYLDIVEPVKSYRCADIAREAHHLCYNEEIASKCCVTCEEIRVKDNSECEFGDRNPDYCKRIESRDCYDENVRGQCCSTCGNNYKNIAGCEYGDRSFYLCRDAVDRPRDCYADQTYNRACCETCPKLESGPEGCEFGDRNFWCTDIQNNKNRCYDPSIAKACCKTCVPEGPSGCEFGDRSDYCTQADCDDPYRRDQCCQTCSNSGPSNGNEDCPNSDDSDCSSRIYASGACYTYGDSCCNRCSQYLTDIPRCKYGDKFSWCPEYVSRYKGRVCEDQFITDNCCLSCEPYIAEEEEEEEEDGSNDNNNPGSEQCIDDASWCSGIRSGACYDPQTETTCCARCKALKRSTEKCLYGNKFSWCNRDYCGGFGKECCDSCPQKDDD